MGIPLDAADGSVFLAGDTFLAQIRAQIAAAAWRQPCVLARAQPRLLMESPGSGDIPTWPQPKAGGCQSLWGQAKQGSSLLLSLLSQCQSIQHPLHIPHQREHQCQKEQWVTKGWLKYKERKDGIWDLSHMWVWVTPFFFTQQERSPCLHPQPTGMLPGLITWLQPN